MSRVWDLLKSQSDLPDEYSEAAHRKPERRNGVRQSVYFPLFIYGHTSSQDPFHQNANTLQVSDSGCLLHLDADVRCGQKLLLMNRTTLEEQEGTVVCLVKKPRHAGLHVGVSFGRLAPEFWRKAV